MEAVAIAKVVSERSQAIEDEALAARCATTNVLITADCAAAVVRIARRIQATGTRAASPFVHMAAAALPGRSGRADGDLCRPARRCAWRKLASQRRRADARNRPGPVD